MFFELELFVQSDSRTHQDKGQEFVVGATYVLTSVWDCIKHVSSVLGNGKV